MKGAMTVGCGPSWETAMRTVGSIGEVSARALRAAAIDIISAEGYAGLNVRELAARCGLQPASIYNHFRSKQDLLFEVMRDIQQEVVRHTVRLLRPDGDPVSQAHEFISWHVEFHIERRKEALIGNRELSSLQPENYRVLQELRDQYEREIRRWIQRGAKRGVFKAPNAKMMSFWVIAALNGLLLWYRPDGPLPKTQLVQVHLRLLLQTLGVADD
jgi:AcrR family transcriptional regulator